MNAIEFVKKYGVVAAKGFLDLPSYTNNQLLMLHAGLRCDELQRLVKSHELVEKWGGLDEAIEATGTSYIKHSDWDDLNKAITDVEACL